jgi:hypothetical protein
MSARQIAVGDRVRGRDVTMGNTREGVVLEVLHPVPLTGWRAGEPRVRPPWARLYRIDTGETYATGGRRTPIVECTELVEEILTATTEPGGQAGDVDAGVTDVVSVYLATPQRAVQGARAPADAVPSGVPRRGRRCGL